MRTCVACRRSGAKSSLMRLRRRSDGVVVPELDPRRGGRSAYVCPTHACVDQAVRRRAIARSL
ncbi:MAG TPA: YlxR family protein, partial [Nannocystaceae bacterium]|nr:YlxR family protein [Nannocystaceae bacterium]